MCTTGGRLSSLGGPSVAIPSTRYLQLFSFIPHHRSTNCLLSNLGYLKYYYDQIIMKYSYMNYCNTSQNPILIHLTDRDARKNNHMRLQLSSRREKSVWHPAVKQIENTLKVYNYHSSE